MPDQACKNRSDTCNNLTAKCEKHIKRIVVIGNGPSAIALSYVLAGNVPIYTGGSEDHHLHLRLMDAPDQPLILQNLEELATGCEGRSNNPVSVLFDMLNHPDADLGIERESQLQWVHRPDLEVDHVILGKGKPGGCWESLEGNIQTVSLGNWMELPDLKLSDVCGEERRDKRVRVADVAKYYQEYVRLKGLSNYFVNDFEVISVREVTELPCSSLRRDSQSVTNLMTTSEDNAIFNQEELYETVIEENNDAKMEEISTTDHKHDEACICSSISSSTACSSATGSCSSMSGQSQEQVGPLPQVFPSRKSSFPRFSYNSAHYGPRSQNEHMNTPGKRQDIQGLSGCSMSRISDGFLSQACSWDPIVNPDLFCSSLSKSANKLGFREDLNQSRASSWSSFATSARSTVKCAVSSCFPNTNRLFEVTGISTASNGAESSPPRVVKYLTKEVVLATGSYDNFNRLNIPGENLPFVHHSISGLEDVIALGKLKNNRKPIMIVGAGLSAADAIITARNEGLSVVHVFRRSVDDPALIFKKLPKAIYPEYHDVYALMRGDADVDDYVSVPENTVEEISPNKIVTVRKSENETSIGCRKFSVSCVVILIGSSPDLDFLEPKLRASLGIIKDTPISRNNPVEIDQFSNEAVDVPGIYAMGPLVGDNFVRFLQGGAIAIASNVMKKGKNISSKN